MDTPPINSVFKQLLAAAQEAVLAQQVNNLEMTRQNDLEELSQGIISKEDYLRKYPPQK